MAINAYGQDAALAKATTSGTTRTDAKEGNPKGVLGKDDFMKLLLVQLQYQDPTAPTDTEKILTQTSQLAALESADNTNTALEKLSASLSNTQQFGTISAIGRTADLGSDSILHEKGADTSFEVYFQTGIQQGNVEIKDKDGNIVQTLPVGSNPSGVYKFTWDGSTQNGQSAQSGIYHVTANFTDGGGTTQQTRLGAYPIESVRFDKGETFVKLGSNYVPLKNVKEVY